MKLQNTEIIASFTGKISTGSYENEAPFFSLKETYSGDVDDEFINKRKQQLHNFCYNSFKEVEERSQVEKILKQRSDLRFYERNGKQYPSVTSIIGWDADWFISPMALSQYAARGTIVHKQVEIYLQSGKWPQPEDIPEVYPELVIVKKGDLGLKLDDIDFVEYYKKHPFDYIDLEEKVYNDEHRYAGRRDIRATFNNKLAIMDVKTSSAVNREKAFKQMAAYAMATPGIQTDLMVVIPLTNKNKCGYGKPIIEDNIKKYWELFLVDRKNFKQRFGI